VSWIYILNDINEYVDECLLGYSIIAVLSLWSFMVSCWYWAVANKISTVFRWLTLLIGGTFVNYCIMAYARGLRLDGNIAGYDAFLVSPWWHYRFAIVAVSLVYLFAVILSRLFGDSDEQKG
jgi:hypothetical protein